MLGAPLSLVSEAWKTISFSTPNLNFSLLLLRKTRSLFLLLMTGAAHRARGLKSNKITKIEKFMSLESEAAHIKICFFACLLLWLVTLISLHALLTHYKCEKVHKNKLTILCALHFVPFNEKSRNSTKKSFSLIMKKMKNFVSFWVRRKWVDVVGCGPLSRENNMNSWMGC